jgi:hypothetical protein
MPKKKNIIFDILKKNNIKVTGAFHIGAHECEELGFYKELGLDQKNIIWIDAINEKVIEATNRGIPNVYNAIISDVDDEDVVFNVANNFQSSSLLEFKTHLTEHPEIEFVRKIQGKSLTVNSFFERNKIAHPEKYNFWNFDIQGVELMALKGATNYIKYIKAIQIEVNTEELYKDCALIGEIDNFLTSYGFKRVNTDIGRNGWGDALYIIPKNNTILSDITKKYSKTKKLIFNKSRFSKKLSGYNKNYKLDNKQTTHTKHATHTKHIYIKNDKGLGHKIFDLIFAIYLYNLYQGQCIIHYVLVKTKYETLQDPTLDKIFIKANNKIHFITLREYENLNINPKIKIYKIYDKDDIMQAVETFPSYDSLKLHTKFEPNYRLIYKIYDTFGLEDKSIFTINENVLKINYKNPNHIKFIYDIKRKNDYAVVHIRYGDKLNYLKKYLNHDYGDDTSEKEELLNTDVDKYLLYTPEYYIEKINYLLNAKSITSNTNKHKQKHILHNIYIITDSDDLVKEFIMKPTHKFNNNPRVIFLDNLNWVTSFYIMTHASYIIMSCSTFSYSAMYFNKKKATAELLLYHHNNTIDNSNMNIAPEEYAIDPRWIINDDKQYILNYIFKIGFPILKHKFKWRY